MSKLCVNVNDFCTDDLVLTFNTLIWCVKDGTVKPYSHTVLQTSTCLTRSFIVKFTEGNGAPPKFNATKASCIV